MLGYVSLGQNAGGQLRAVDDLSVKDPFFRLQQLVNPQLRYLVELEPWDNEALVDVIFLPPSLGSVALGSAIGAVKGSLRSIYLSDHHFITEPEDLPANQYFSPVVDNPLQFDMSLMRGNEIGVSNPTYGAIEIDNGDGLLDHLLTLSWKGRRIIVKAGAEGFGYDDYAVVFDGLCNTMEHDDRSIILTVSDKGLRLDKEIITQSYAGTGGLEGGNDLAGRMKPLVFGKCFNIEPVLVSPTMLIYQAHVGSMEAFDAVFDSGVALTFDADYPDITSATPAAGEYATCLAQGYLKLGSTPLGRITANVRGGNEGGYVSQVGGICVRMATTLYDNESFPIDSLDTAAWDLLDAEVAGEAGIYINESRTLRQLFDQLLNPCAAYWYFTRYGLLSAASIDVAETADTTIDTSGIEENGLEMVNVIPPAWRITVAYAPVWRVQKEDELAGATTQAQRSFVGNDYRLTIYENRGIRTSSLESMDRVFYTNLAGKVDADALLERLVRIYGSERRMYRAVRLGGLFGQYVGEEINLIYPRLGLNKPVRIMGMSQDAESASSTLELWG